MKILFFIDTLGAGGKERRLTELLKMLATMKDFAFEVIVMSYDIHYKEIFDLKIKIHYVIRNAKKDLSVFNMIYHICKESKPDLVHCWDSMTAIYSIPACKILGIKLVNGMVVNTPVKRSILNKYILRARLSFPFSDAIVGNSKAGLKAYNSPHDKSFCIYNGMDLKRFQDIEDADIVKEKLFLNKTEIIIGMVASFSKKKDYFTLIQTAIKLISTNNKVSFILVGGGVTIDEMKDLVPNDISDKIKFLGKISNIESIVNIFDIGILLTNSKVHGEGISNSIIEYMALGKPVIATRGGGTTEVIIEGQNGFLIDPGDVNALLNKIDTLIQNSEMRQRMGNSGRKMIVELFDIRIMTKNYIALYENILKDRNSFDNQ